MRWTRLVRAELRKLTTTRMPWAFVAVLALIAAINALAILIGTDMDGSKGFIATAEDQRSMLSFGANALFGTSLFGAIAVAREYGHETVVPTFLAAPRRHVTMLAQLTAVMIGGLALGMLGGAMVLAAGAVALPFTDYAFLIPTAVVVQLVATSTLAGGVGAVVGAGIGAVVRNAGGAVAVAFLLLFITPQLVPQLATGTAEWMPPSLLMSLAGVAEGPATLAAVGALVAYAVVLAVAGIGVVQRRDVI